MLLCRVLTAEQGLREEAGREGGPLPLRAVWGPRRARRQGEGDGEPRQMWSGIQGLSLEATEPKFGDQRKSTPVLSLGRASLPWSLPPWPSPPPGPGRASHESRGGREGRVDPSEGGGLLQRAGSEGAPSVKRQKKELIDSR